MVSPLSQHEILLRRFSIKNPNEATQDKGAVGGYQLNWAALKWDPDGASVFREDVLAEAGLTRFVILEEDRPGIAVSTKQRIEDFAHADPQSGKEVHPFTARANPRTAPPPLDTDPAHASVVVAAESGLSKKQLERAQKRLAAQAFTVESVGHPE